MPGKPFLAFDEIPRDVLVDIEGIRKLNPQRFEMEQITAITLLDKANLMVAGYRDVAADEFWVRGHMPDFPLMPGVLLIESAAQMGAFFCGYMDAIPDHDFLGLGGCDNVRFRGIVRPGDRLWLVGKVQKLSKRIMTFDFQGFIEGRMVFEASLIGIPLAVREISDPTS